MRKESTEIVKAFLARKPKRMARTATDGNTITLHGNEIAWWNDDGSISMTLAGWGRTTTRDRLNTLCMLWLDTKPFHQKKRVQYYNDDPIDEYQIITIQKIELIAVENFFAELAA